MATDTNTPETIAFSTDDARIRTLLEQVHTIEDLGALMALADWDQQTAMPRGAGEVRTHQATTLQGILHDRQTDPALGKVLGELEQEVQQPRFSDADRGLVRQVLRAYQHAVKLPRTLVEELTRVRSAGFEAWLEARAKDDFAIFAPWLQQTITLQREVADRYGYTETRYDALLDEYEPDLTSRKVEQLFTPVKEVSTTMLRRIQQSGHTVDRSSLFGNFAPEKQEQLCEQVLRTMGYDFNRGQLARSEHPFTTSFGAPDDVRLTARYGADYLPMSVMAAMHEGGHGLYEQGIARSLVRTPLASGASLGVHESQSRLWENAIGRSQAFWQNHYKLLQTAFPEHFSTVTVESYARALNQVEPSLIRVEADEVTYNLHIVIRFELEKELINGNLSIESLPGLWNKKYEEYLNITPPTAVEGVLQDTHWTFGFGYFPTYTLGNLYAAQIYHTLRKDFSDFDARLAAGDSSFVLNWLHERLHQYGAVYQPEELIQRVTGERPDPQYFVRYLTEKFEKVYDLPRA